MSTGNSHEATLGRIDRAGPAELSELLHIGSGIRGGSEQMGVLLVELLARPMPSPSGPGAHATSAGVAGATLHALLHDPDPQIALLREAKEQAKRWRSEAGMAPEVPTALYYACIAAALARCGESITGLTPEAQREGFGWCLAQSWVTESLKGLIARALGALPGSSR